ncbi:hypothetical protein Scep_007870 [Stephania cephalantha]|uniref:Uncharacterized protein n=1 Tax=Stephania cephalantha TaxID=152367 RepID=A0AAP0KAN0_9MAGN
MSDAAELPLRALTSFGGSRRLFGLCHELLAWERDHRRKEILRGAVELDQQQITATRRSRTAARQRAGGDRLAVAVAVVVDAEARAAGLWRRHGRPAAAAATVWWREQRLADEWTSCGRGALQQWCRGTPAARRRDSSDGDSSGGGRQRRQAAGGGTARRGGAASSGDRRRSSNADDSADSGSTTPAGRDGDSNAGSGGGARWCGSDAGSGAVTTVARLRRRRGEQRDGVVGLIEGANRRMSTTRWSCVHSRVEQPISSRGSPTGMHPLSEHPPYIVAPTRYSSSIVVEHPVKYVAPFRMFSQVAAQASRKCRTN